MLAVKLTQNKIYLLTNAYQKTETIALQILPYLYYAYQLVPNPTVRKDVMADVTTTSGRLNPKSIVLDYLRNRTNDLPFSTEYTFCHCFERDGKGVVFDGSLEWHRWTLFVMTLAKEFDHTHYLNMLNVLHRHLVIGWLLSAVTYEMESGLTIERRYRHAAYAGWRTFDAAIDDRGDYPLKRDVKLGASPLVQALHTYLLSVILQWQSCMETIDNGRLRDTDVSDAFIKSMLPEMQRRIRVAYEDASAQVYEALALL